MGPSTEYRKAIKYINNSDPDTVEFEYPTFRDWYIWTDLDDKLMIVSKPGSNGVYAVMTNDLVYFDHTTRQTNFYPMKSRTEGGRTILDATYADTGSALFLYESNTAKKPLIIKLNNVSATEYDMFFDLMGTEVINYTIEGKIGVHSSEDNYGSERDLMTVC